MGYFRFFRRVRILPGVTLNVSKGGISTSFGVRGAHYTVNRRGTRATVGFPGSGLFYTDFRPYGPPTPRALPPPSATPTIATPPHTWPVVPIGWVIVAVLVGVAIGIAIAGQ